MPQTAVAADLHQTLDVHLSLAAQVAFHRQVIDDVVTQRSDLGVGQLAHTSIRTDLGRLQNFLRSFQADAINIGQANFNALVTREVNTFNTCHNSTSTLVFVCVSGHCRSHTAGLCGARICIYHIFSLQKTIPSSLYSFYKPKQLILLDVVDFV